MFNKDEYLSQNKKWLYQNYFHKNIPIIQNTKSP